MVEQSVEERLNIIYEEQIRLATELGNYEVMKDDVTLEYHEAIALIDGTIAEIKTQIRKSKQDTEQYLSELSKQLGSNTTIKFKYGEITLK